MSWSADNAAKSSWNGRYKVWIGIRLCVYNKVLVINND